MNLVFITQSLGFAGAAKMLTFVANELNRRGHGVSIVNLNITATGVHQPVKEQIKIYDLDGKVRLLKKWECVRQIKKIAKAEKADVLIGFTMFPNLFGALAGKMAGIPMVMSERGDPKALYGTDMLSRTILRIINSASGGVFQTDGAQAFYGKHLREQGVVIPNPIFVKGEIPRVADSQREKSVVSVGRLDNRQKRYDIMLQAFALFHEKHPEYILRIYGDGPDLEKINTWIEEQGPTDAVQLMGLTQKPMEVMAVGGMFLITSDYEGIANSLLEAMAVGLPCVSTDHTPGGARLLIQDHENGLLAPMGDPEKLAAAMCEFAEDPALAARCGEKAKEVLTRFAPERIIDMWEDYCKKMVNEYHNGG